MASAKNSLTPETFSSSVLAYTLMVQHGGAAGFFGNAADVFSATNTQSTFVLARVITMTPSQSRTITRVYEINNAVGGRAVELIPSAITDDNVAISRIETYQQTLLEALDPKGHMFVDRYGNASVTPERGGSEQLAYQKNPFNLLRLIFFPNKVVTANGTGTFNESTINARLDLYCNCFVSDLSRTVDVSGGGSGIVQADATIQVTKRRSRFLSIEDSNTFKSSLLQEADSIQTFGMPKPATGFPTFTAGNPGSYAQTVNSLGGPVDTSV